MKNRIRGCCYLAVGVGCILLASQTVKAVNGVTNVVTTVADSGPGSLRQAILDANANPGLDTIAFNIFGLGPFTITPGSPLPTITDSVIIDGATQPGYAGLPLIQINGSSLPADTDGLLITAGGSTIRGLVINLCPRDAIRLQGPGTNIIQGNFLGTDPTGTQLLANGEGGVMVYGSPGNLIGGTNPSTRNLISGGNQNGVYLFNSGTTGNVIEGNYIGTSITGLTPLGNVYNGVEVSSCSSNLIGGTSPGAGNLISGNGQSGIYFISFPATDNLVQGNYIGVDALGAAALANGQDGVTLNGSSGPISGNTIGGTTTAAGNVLSGNGESGVFLSGIFGAENNSIEGNYIGTDASGRVAIPNQVNGITIDGVANNTIGGTSAGAQNVISGNNQFGVMIYAGGAYGNVVSGNFIGPDATGESALGNSYGGVSIQTASGNTVGIPNGRNVISGNSRIGVYLTGDGGSSNLVEANYIGTDATGESAMANFVSGVYIENPGNIIGGVTLGSGNVISGNAEDGLYLFGPAATNNVVEGNFIGTDATGLTPVANGICGVGVSNAPANMIGGTASGAGNVISGNVNSGIILGGNTGGTAVQGNYIGTDLTGNNAVPNEGGGIYFYASGTNLIGGTVPGARNIISGNYQEGLSIGDPGANGNTIQGNYIGTKADGISPLGNQLHNIDFLDTASSNLVGGTTAAADNRIAFVTTGEYDGVRIRSGSLGNEIIHNSIFSNAGWGIVLGNAGETITNLVTLTEAASDGIKTAIQGSMNTYANGQFLIQFYQNIGPDPTGYGEGLNYLGSTSITTDGNGQANFGITLPAGVASGAYLSATATDSGNTTWDFGPDFQVLALPQLTISGASSGSAPGTISISWPTSPAGFVLEQTTNLAPPAMWTSITNAVAVNGNTNTVSIIPSGMETFYRLGLQ